MSRHTDPCRYCDSPAIQWGGNTCIVCTTTIAYILIFDRPLVIANDNDARGIA